MQNHSILLGSSTLIINVNFYLVTAGKEIVRGRERGRERDREKQRRFSGYFQPLCAAFAALQSVIIKSSNHWAFPFWALSYKVHAPFQQHSSTAPVSTVNWARHAFFTCPRGKSQPGQGKQICCFTFFFSVGAQVLFFCFSSYFSLAHLLAWIHFWAACLLCSLLPSFLLYILCFVKFVSLFIHTWLGNRTQRRTRNRQQRRQTARSGFELHAARQQLQPLSWGCQAPGWRLMDSRSQAEDGGDGGGADRRGIAKWKLMNEIWYTMSGADTPEYSLCWGRPGLPGVFNLIHAHVLHTHCTYQKI